MLLAEDNPANQAVIRSILEHAGLDVDIVNNGRMAVEAVTATPYDVILMDISMRGDAPSGADIPPERVAAAAGSSFEEIRYSRNRSQITNMMMAGASSIAAGL